MTSPSTLHPTYNKLRTNLSYIFLIPSFFLAFTTLYRPERMIRFFEMGRDIFSFNVTIVSCIMLGVMALSRTIMLLSSRLAPLNQRGYLFWQVGELVAMGLFSALYITLMSQGQYTYYNVVGICLLYLFIILIYPYTILGLCWHIVAIRESEIVEDDSLIRFHDNQKQVKIIIASSAVIYIESKENYVVIHYKDGERIREYTLRSSMIALEELLTKHGIVRCQRSYYINPAFVKVLRKDKEGMISAELTLNDQKAIPVSPRYYDALTALL